MVRAQGIQISVGTRQKKGRLLRLDGIRQTAFGLSDLISMANYSEVEIVGINGAPSTFIATESLLSKPQVIVGYSERWGFPILLGASDVFKYHAALIGMTQGGKSTLLALILLQLSQLGFAIILFAMKCLDASLLASLWAACNSLTRLDEHNQPTKAPFYIYTLEPGMKTRGINVVPVIRSNVPSERAARSIMYRGLSQGGAEHDARRRFFSTYEFAMFQRLPEVGNSLAELAAKFAEMEQTQEEKRFSAGFQSEVGQLGYIEQANLPEDHPANIDVLTVLERGGAIVFDANIQDAGALGTANAALVLLMIAQLKRKHMPGRDCVIYVPIDESQKFNQELLKQLVEQLAGFSIRLLLCYHNLEQLGENQETLGMTQLKFIFNANPGGETDRYLQSLHGTKTDYLFNFGGGDGYSINESVGETVSPTGTSISVTKGSGKSGQSNYGFSETEKPVWPPNATLELNGDTNLFVLSVNPGAECACYGPIPILCNRGGYHLTWAEVRAMSEAALKSDPHAFIPGAPQIRLLEAPELSQELREKRSRWITILRKSAENVRRKLS